mmetsp:Transcript_6566/g.12928  ORF Transcript_6566/g.12928 Transcript_6566/m.12928 type:complete len:103 (-) Transcript_6566:943-1251(-)
MLRRQEENQRKTNEEQCPENFNVRHSCSDQDDDRHTGSPSRPKAKKQLYMLRTTKADDKHEQPQYMEEEVPDTSWREDLSFARRTKCASNLSQGNGSAAVRA